MMIHEITSKVGKHRPRKRLGRGESSGLGKTSGRGHKGAASRSGWSLPPQYQGGQLNFIQRMPKRGFTNAPFRKQFHIVNVKSLDAIARDGDDVTIESLAAAGVVRDANLPLKVLGEGEITKKITVTAAKFTASAKSKIEAAGGTANEIVKTKWSRPRPEKKPKSPKEGQAASVASEDSPKSKPENPKKPKSPKTDQS